MKNLIMAISLLLITSTLGATTACPEKMNFTITEKSKCPDSCYIKPNQRINFTLTDAYPGMDVTITQSSTGERTEDIKGDKCPKTVTKIAERRELADGTFFNSSSCSNDSKAWIRAEISEMSTYAPTEELEKYSGHFQMRIHCCMLGVQNGTSYCKN